MLHKQLYMVAALILLALLAPPPASCLAAWAGRVSLVADGDSLEVQRSGRTVRLRLFAVDAPEKNQPYANRARKFVTGLCLKREVTVIPEDVDQYGRIVATVLLPDGRNLNEELVRAGLAWHYRHYSNSRRLAKLEAQARAARRGLWQDPAPIPPWDYRHSGHHRGGALENSGRRFGQAQGRQPGGR